MKLYHYVHCPFCVRVRMGLSFLGQDFESRVTPYDDEATPIRLTGKKMLPIMEYEDGSALNESLDILKKLDVNDRLDWKQFSANESTLNPLLDRIGSPVHSLAMPYWIWTPEFGESSRKYFQTKKEVKRGPFKDLVKNHKTFVDILDLILFNEVLSELKPFYKSDKITIMDLMIAAHVWGMYVVPEYQFAPHIHAYLMRVKAETGFNYHEDYWR
ncbi:MAG: glutathione S-transferase N-terminal domain-containing protein [Bacteriovorax sp.]|nr:glutathione S-transferase N-terminal domain-containing protein [Bacteriovorax sp.]